MVKPTLSERLQHILEAIEQIERHTAGMDAAALKNERFRQLGVE